MWPECVACYTSVLFEVQRSDDYDDEDDMH
jgi:hypothetical protein